jgi:hypothetical protein
MDHVKKVYTIIRWEELRHFPSPPRLMGYYKTRKEANNQLKVFNKRNEEGRYYFNPSFTVRELRIPRDML